jgi:hypothetical protein
MPSRGDSKVRGCNPQVIENLQEQSPNSIRSGNKKGPCRSEVIVCLKPGILHRVANATIKARTCFDYGNGQGLERSFLTISKHYNRVKSLRLLRSDGVFPEEALSRLLSHFPGSLSV